MSWHAGSVYVDEGPINKVEGCHVEKPFGPINSWHVRYSSAGPTLVAVTAKATYLLSKPAQEYKKISGVLEEQANLAWHVLQVGWGPVLLRSGASRRAAHPTGKAAAAGASGTSQASIFWFILAPWQQWHQT